MLSWAEFSVYLITFQFTQLYIAVPTLRLERQFTVALPCFDLLHVVVVSCAVASSTSQQNHRRSTPRSLTSL